MTTVTPVGIVDLRGRQITTMRYPAQSVVVIAGIPGSGKSTLLRGLARTGGATVVDSDQVRAQYRRWLGLVPHPVWHPLVHFTHYLRVRAAIRRSLTDSEPVLVHDCGTRGWVTSLLRRVAIRNGHVHLVLIAVPPEEARASQRRRGRLTRKRAFEAHCRLWADLTADGPAGLIPGAASVVMLDRVAASRLNSLRFDLGGRNQEQE